MGDLAKLITGDSNQITVTLTLLILEAFYLILLMQLAKFLQPSKTINLILRIAMTIIFILSIIAFNPFVVVSNKVAFLITVHIILCSVECYMIALGLKDIYSENLNITQRLWGSVAVYLLIALGWASFYELLLLCDPQTLGVLLSPGYQTYAESLYFSLCNLSGTSSAYTNPSHLIRNLALIEGVWGVLFLVMLIGRLFSLPTEKKDNI